MAIDTLDPAKLDAIKRLLPLADAGAAPTLSDRPVMTDAALPRLSAPDAPAAVLTPTSRDLTHSRILGDQNELTRLQSSGSGIDQISNPIGRTFARIGDGLLRAVAPRVEGLLPSTQGNNERLQGIQQQRLSSDLNADKEQAGTELLNAQPELKQAALDNKSLQIQNQGQHYADQAETAREKEAGVLRQQGSKKDADGKIVPLEYDEMSPLQQGQVDAIKARKDYDTARADFEKAKNNPDSFVGKQAQARMDHATALEVIAHQKMGMEASAQDLQRQRMGLAEDKFYNPQPTGTERKTGDLADSGILQLHTMREIANRRADQFGPGAGSAQKFQTWLGSEDPDAAKYRAAQTFMAEHGAGVFGSRNMGVINDNKKLADQRQNVGALNAAFDQAEQTFQHFSAAGKTHGKGAVGGAAQGGTSSIKVGQQVKLKNGTTITVTKVHPDGSFE